MENQPPTKRQRTTNYDELYDTIIATNQHAIGIASYVASKKLLTKFIIRLNDINFVSSFERLEREINYEKSMMDAYIFNDACVNNDIFLANYFAKKYPDKFVFNLDTNKCIKKYYINETNPSFDDCPICQENNNANIKIKPCKHSFCEKCIMEWENKMVCQDGFKFVTCPLCRKNADSLVSVY